MVRDVGESIVVGIGSPHVRGDGPSWSPVDPRFAEFSPRAWGWSEELYAAIVTADVLPTCVGMVRREWQTHGLDAGSPHVRGDGPHITSNTALTAGFSPRAWGWSDRPSRVRR